MTEIKPGTVLRLETESAADRLQALFDQAATDGEVGDDTPILDVAGYTATFGDLREVLATAASATPASVWIYADDDGTLSPVDYATREVAQAHAEAAWRFVTENDGPTPLSWRSAFADDGVQTEDAADFDLIDEDSGVRTGWQVRRIRVVDEMPTGDAGSGARA